MTPIVPRSGPCQPWITAGDVKKQPGCGEYVDDVLLEAASVASEILYRLSGRQFAGACGPVTVRPLCRPTDADEHWYSAVGLGVVSWGTCGGMSAGANVASHFGHSNPRDVELGTYPVTEVTVVKIDGDVIPADEYRLQDYRVLSRVLPTAESTPTDRYGWPTAQRLDLPDTEPGTFSVTYTYGYPPPAAGLRAAKALAAAFAKAFSGDTNQLPVRITSIVRQGVSAATTDVEDIVSKGLTGIYMVDVFIQAYNPSRQTRKSSVWSPDLGRPRRMPRTS